MNGFEVNIIMHTKAIDEANVQSWLDDFVVPDLIARWSDGTIDIETEIEEIQQLEVVNVNDLSLYRPICMSCQHFVECSGKQPNCKDYLKDEDDE